MHDLQTLQRNFGSMFVTNAFLHRFLDRLSTYVVKSVGLADEPGSSTPGAHTADAASPLACVLGAAKDICASSFVEDEESLERMLEVIHRQFDVADDCNNADRALALKNLEESFLLVSDEAWAALEEVQEGFPSSAGDFDAWRRSL